jgi:acyl transferase domain-containing protein/acyl carrier protein
MPMRPAENHESKYAVAIVGLACRFPGAANADQFWRNLKNGVESISCFTDEELRRSGVDPALWGDPAYIRAKGVLEDIETFDAAFFAVPPRESEIMDPQHRLLLECAWQALENAACNPETHKGRIGVYTGIGSNSYLIHHLLPNPKLLARVDPFQLLLCNQGEFAPLRTSYKLNLTGPSLNVGTSCSTSLAAVHLACQSLLAYQCDLALAAGVRVELPQRRGYRYHEGGILSPDGHCRPFDAGANGTVSGSGAGVVVLKRLAEALENGDHIYAVIRGGAMNNDGAAKVGFAAPSVTGQVEVIAEALEMAGVTADTIGYVEAHGTATPMGDPIELRALTQAFRLSTDKRAYCAIGSVKANIGHLDAAAGMAAIIKTALVLKHGLLPPSINFQVPNPEIDFQNSPFYVQTRLEEWKTEKTTRRAGVSAFGVGGTNVHLVLEEPPQPLPPQTHLPDRTAHLLVLSAKSATALDQACVNLAAFLRENPHVRLSDVARTLSLGRKSFPFRHALVSGSVREALADLETKQNSDPLSGALEGRDRSYGEETVTALIDALEDPNTRETECRSLLAALGQRWMQGAAVAWDRLYPSGRHRFLPLPTYPFERRTYWIEAQKEACVKEDPISGKNPDPAQWFYLPSWRRTLLPAHGGRSGPAVKALAKVCLLFLDESDASGPGTLLARKIKEKGQRVIRVHVGEAFKKTDTDAYTMPVQGEDGYHALLTALEQADVLPDEIVHLWSLTPRQRTPLACEEIQNRGFFSLLHLARALAKCAPARPATITLITNGVEEVTGEETLIPEKATVLGPARVIPQEYPWMACRVLDVVLPARPSGWADLVTRLEEELSSADNAPLVAHRGHHRWVLHPEKVLLPADQGPLPFRHEGVYLITGGVGAIGMLCAEFLAREYRARLVLIGRSRPDERVRQRLSALEAAGAKVLVLPADVADEAAMRAAILRAETLFGAINGVIHGAGVTGEKAFRTVAETRRGTCEAHFRAKVLGTQVLARLLEGRDLDFCLLHSSLSAILGGLGFAAYAAANRFLDAFARERNRQARFPWICINWEGWRFQKTRMVAPLDKNLSAFALRPEEGLAAFKRVLASRATHLAVSTGDLPTRMAQWRQGRATPPLSGHARPALKTPYTTPGNEIEEKLLAIWQALFGIDVIGIHDDFFELNGDSVLAAQAAARIREEFGIDMPLPEMFERPTVCQQAAFVLEAQLSGLKSDELEELFAEVNPLPEQATPSQYRQDYE